MASLTVFFFNSATIAVWPLIMEVTRYKSKTEMLSEFCKKNFKLYLIFFFVSFRCLDVDCSPKPKKQCHRVPVSYLHVTDTCSELVFAFCSNIL